MENFIPVKGEVYNLGKASQKALRPLMPVRKLWGHMTVPWSCLSWHVATDLELNITPWWCVSCTVLGICIIFWPWFSNWLVILGKSHTSSGKAGQTLWFCCSSVTFSLSRNRHVEQIWNNFLPSLIDLFKVVLVLCFGGLGTSCK